MVKKLSYILFCVFVLLISSVVCYAAGKKVTISIGHIYNVKHNEAVALENLKKALADASEGRINLVIYPASQMGSEREMAEQVIMGTLDMGLSDGPTWANALNVPQVAVFGLPFLYKNIDGQKNVIENILVDVSSQYMVPAGVRPLFGFSASIRGAILTKKPINVADDIKGIKMRVPEITMYVDTWKNLGANPTTTAWSEAYTALSQGVVDGAEVDPSTIVDANLHEVTKYFSRTNHMGTVHIISMNEQKWQKIPADLQKIFIEEAKKISVAQIEDRKRTDGLAEKKMMDAGVVFNHIADNEIQKMAAMQEPLYSKFAKEYGMGDVIEKIRALGMSTEK